MTTTALTKREIAQKLREAPRRGEFPPEVRAALEQRKQQHQVAASIAALSWGKGLTPDSREAISFYLQANAIDVTEVDVLGDNIYRNAKYFLRRLSEMVGGELVEYVRADHVVADPRLKIRSDAGDEKSRLELRRREDERIAFAIPDEATAACVFRVKLKSVPHEFAGAKWIVRGRKKKVKDFQNGQFKGWKEVTADPVGDETPVETVETRACRRCMRLIASTIPALKFREDEMRDQALLLRDIIAQGRATARAAEVFEPRPALLRAGTDDDPYGPEVLEPSPPVAPFAEPRDEHPAGEVIAPAAAASAPSEARDVTLPNWRNHPLAGMRLRDVATPELEALHITLREKGGINQQRLVDAIAEELEARRTAPESAADQPPAAGAEG